LGLIPFIMDIATSTVSDITYAALIIALTTIHML